jgi:DNA-damage-inducible protein J
METVNLNVRVDKDVKQSAEAVANALGMNLSTAVNIFLRQMVNHDGMPFDVRLSPNDATRAAMKEADGILSGRIPAKRYASAQEMMDDLDAEDDAEQGGAAAC